MSLVCWLPLTGTLENKGISNISFTNTATSYITVNTSGKIGSCYAFNSSANNNGIYSADNGFMANYINNKSWSICAWIKTSSTDTCIISLSYGLRMFAGNSTYISLYNSSRTVSCTSSVAVKDGNWHHVTATYNVSTNEIKFYVDGINTGNATYTSGYTYASSWTNGLFIGKDPNNSTVSDHYLYRGSMNDVRIYDNCLSAAEVKEINQGLVLHYKLDYAMGNINLIINGDGNQGNVNWSNSSRISTDVPSNTNIVKSYYNNQTTTPAPFNPTHSYSLSVWVKSTGTSGYTYPSLLPYDVDGKFIAYSQCREGFNINTMTTLSQQLKAGDTKIYVTSLANWNANSGHYYNAAAIFGYTDSHGHTYPDGEYTQNTPRFGSGTNAKTNLDKTNNIITLNSAYTGPTIPAGTSICAASDGSTYYYPFGAITKTSVSSWTQKTTTLNPQNIHRLRYAHSLIYMADWANDILHAGITLIDLTENAGVIDSSGYGHNGTINGTLTLSDNTARYSICGYFGEHNTPNIIVNDTSSFAPALSNCTVTWWGKYDTTKTLLLTGQTTSYYIAASNNNTYYHGTVGSNTKTFYKDGVAGSYKCAADGWHFFAVTGLDLSTWTALKLNSYSSDWRLRGYINDLRIYSTILSADDIKQLYQVGAKVDNLHNIHTFEYSENSSAIKLTKQGQFKEGEIQEDTTTKFYKTDKIIKAKQFIER